MAAAGRLTMPAGPSGPVLSRARMFGLVRARIVMRAWWVWDNRAMSPRSRGRPPGRGRRRQPNSRQDGRRAAPDRPRHWLAAAGQDAGECWFDEPTADRRSWAAPLGHGMYRGMDLELLDPGDDDELGFLLEALHHGGGRDAPGSDRDLAALGEPASPRRT
jgi:hypothetical protein